MDIDSPQYRAIEDEVNPPKPLQVCFYHQPKVTRVENGVNIYEPKLMATVRVKGENSSISKAATPQLMAEYKAEYEHFQSKLIRNLTPLCAITDQMTAQSLIDMGITSVDDLAQANELPMFDHLRGQAQQLLDIKNGTHTNRQEQHNHQEGLQGAIEKSGITRGAEKGHGSIGQKHIDSRPEKESHQEKNQDFQSLNYSFSI